MLSAELHDLMDGARPGGGDAMRWSPPEPPRLRLTLRGYPMTPCPGDRVAVTHNTALGQLTVTGTIVVADRCGLILRARTDTGAPHDIALRPEQIVSVTPA